MTQYSNVHPIFKNILSNYSEFHERPWELHGEQPSIIAVEDEPEEDCPRCAHVQHCNGGYTGEYHFEKSLGFDKHDPEFIDAHKEFWNREGAEE